MEQWWSVLELNLLVCVMFVHTVHTVVQSCEWPGAFTLTSVLLPVLPKAGGQVRLH